MKIKKRCYVCGCLMDYDHESDLCENCFDDMEDPEDPGEEGDP